MTLVARWAAVVGCVAALAACDDGANSSGGNNSSAGGSGGSGGSAAVGGAGGAGGATTGGNGGAGGQGGMPCEVDCQQVEYALGIEGQDPVVAGMTDGGAIIISGGFTLRARRVDAAGNTMWQQIWADPNTASEVEPEAITVAGDDIFFAGTHDGTAHALGAISLPESTGDCAVLVRLSGQDGTAQVARQFCEPNHGRAIAFGIDATPNGDVWMLSFTFDAIDFGAGPVTISPGMSSFAIARFDRDGTHQASFGLSGSFMYLDQPGSNGDAHRPLVATGDGGFVLGGSGGLDLDLGGGTVEGMTSTGRGFVARFDAQGAHVWSRGIADDMGSSGSTSIDVLPSGDVVAASRVFAPQINIDGLTLARGLNALRFAAADGTLQWAESFDPMESPTALVAVGDAIVLSGQHMSDGHFLRALENDGSLLFSEPLGDATVLRMAEDTSASLLIAGRFTDPLVLVGDTYSPDCNGCRRYAARMSF